MHWEIVIVLCDGLALLYVLEIRLILVILGVLFTIKKHVHELHK